MNLLLKTPFWLPFVYPSLEWKINDSQKNIYLTFDDGPIPEATPVVLDILKDFDAVATFFCVGDNIQKHPDIFKRITTEGHNIGNHTFHHLKGWNTSVEDYIENVDLCDNAIAVAGGSSELFRPPYGKIKFRAIKKLKKRYRIIMWDVLTSDYNPRISPHVCLESSIKNTESGSIVVFHDNIKSLEKVKYVLPRYLDHFQKKGFKFKVL